jgi:hypothetical protein
LRGKTGRGRADDGEIAGFEPRGSVTTKMALDSEMRDQSSPAVSRMVARSLV